LLIELAAVFLDKVMRVALHRPERRAHVMRDAVGKPLQFPDCFAKLAGAFGHHLLEMSAVPADFIFGS
jgi:hypothetical protein